MKPSLAQSVELVCAMARDYYAKTVSPDALYEASHYGDHAGEITRDVIAAHLKKHPELVGDWWAYSENKRTNRGWHLIFEDDQHLVRYYEGARIDQEEVFDDLTEACAAYIKNEFEDFR